MSRIFIDGFEGGSLDLWEDSSTGELDNSGLISGDYCFSNGILHKNLQEFELQELYLGFHIFRNYMFNYPILLEFYLNFSNDITKMLFRKITLMIIKDKFGIHLTPAKSIQGQFSLCDGIAIPDLKSHFQIGIKKILVNTIQLTVKVNNYTIIDSKHYGEWNNADVICFPENETFGDLAIECPNEAYIDDLVFDNSELPGVSRIQAIRPSADGNENQFLPFPTNESKANIISAIDDDETSYIYANEGVSENSFNMSNLDVNVLKIKSIQTSTKARFRNRTGELRTGIESNGKIYYSNRRALTPEFIPFNTLWQKNPESNLDWTVLDIDSLQIAIKAEMSLDYSSYSSSSSSFSSTSFSLSSWHDYGVGKPDKGLHYADDNGLSYLQEVPQLIDGNLTSIPTGILDNDIYGLDFKQNRSINAFKLYCAYDGSDNISKPTEGTYNITICKRIDGQNWETLSPVLHLDDISIVAIQTGLCEVTIPFGRPCFGRTFALLFNCTPSFKVYDNDTNAYKEVSVTEVQAMGYPESMSSSSKNSSSSSSTNLINYGLQVSQLTVDVEVTQNENLALEDYGLQVSQLTVDVEVTTSHSIF